MTPKQTQIIFHLVESPQAKVTAILNVIKQYYELGRKVLVSVPNEEAAKYVDHLLWKYQEESFLPHHLASKASLEPIVITTALANLNQAHVLVNLCPQANPICSQFDYVFELFDNTHPEKKLLSLQRQSEYQKAGHSVISQ